ncbi:arginine--tRNA ligase, partial [Candidatus Saccharibacteria bacterium]|nr:arginine--tRNA ligase [Candidatus Saccharibacteria bacterium]
MQERIKQCVAGLFSINVEPMINVPDEQFGDLATNVAMQIAGQLGENPREIAEAIAEKLRTFDDVTEVSVAGPGFINLRFSDEYLLQQAQSEPAKTLTGKKYLVEYSDPNPFKPLHAGHLYTTLVGDVLARLVEGAGAETIRLNFGGDVGMHVGKTMWAVLRELGGEDVEAVKELPHETLGEWMGARYVEGNNAYDDDEQDQAEIKAVNKRVYQLHAENDHDSAFAQIYWYLRDASYDFFKKLYEELQVVAFDRFIPESEVAA